MEVVLHNEYEGGDGAQGDIHAWIVHIVQGDGWTGFRLDAKASLNHLWPRLSLLRKDASIQLYTYIHIIYILHVYKIRNLPSPNFQVTTSLPHHLLFATITLPYTQHTWHEITSIG